MVDSAGPELTTFILRRAGKGGPPWRRAPRVGSLLLPGAGAIGTMMSTHCLIAGQFGMRLRIGPKVRDALQQVSERWDGKGAPAKLAGEEIALAARIVVTEAVADLADVKSPYTTGRSPGTSRARSRRPRWNGCACIPI